MFFLRKSADKLSIRTESPSRLCQSHCYLILNEVCLINSFHAMTLVKVRWGSSYKRAGGSKKHYFPWQTKKAVMCIEVTILYRKCISLDIFYVYTKKIFLFFFNVFKWQNIIVDFFFPVFFFKMRLKQRLWGFVLFLFFIFLANPVYEKSI